MKECFLVGLGGMLGSVARYLSGAYFVNIFPDSKFPWGTFFVNVLGCLLIGILAGLSTRLTSFNSEIRLLCITGVLGGFTTFSAFGLESVQLFKDGATSIALIYIGGSVMLGLLLVYLGLKITA